jgi:hypothetical protein
MTRRLIAAAALAIGLGGCSMLGLEERKPEVQIVTVEPAPPKLAPECTADNPREPRMDDSKDANGSDVLAFMRAQLAVIRKMAALRSVCRASIDADERRRDEAKSKPVG